MSDPTAEIATLVARSRKAQAQIALYDGGLECVGRHDDLLTHVANLAARIFDAERAVRVDVQHDVLAHAETFAHFVVVVVMLM